MTKQPFKLSKSLQSKVDMARHQTSGGRDSARLIMSCLDLTSLTGHETKSHIEDLCDKAVLFNLASVCVYPEQVSLAARLLKNTDVVTATVINYPYAVQRTGSDHFATAVTTSQDVASAIAHGATQIDIVQPYVLERPGFAIDVLRAARIESKGAITLKSILETAAFYDERQLRDAALIAISAGVNCLKTSTGKHPHGGATLEAAAILLDTISISHRPIGVKITGGLSTIEDCMPYISLKRIFSGWDSIRPETFRFGSSRLLENLTSHFENAGLDVVKAPNGLPANDTEFAPSLK